MAQVFDIQRLRRHGLRTFCVVCGSERRHRFEVRLRDLRSCCCNARLVPLWHVQIDAETGAPRHPKLRARAHALREQEIARLRRF